MVNQKDLKARFDAAVSKRDSLQATLSRLTGALEAAEKNQQEIEAECRGMGVDPDDLPAEIEKRTTELATLLGQIEASLQEADKVLSPYMKDKT